MIFASFNADGDLKHLAEFFSNVLVGIYAVATFFVVMIALSFFILARATRRGKQMEAGEAIKATDEIIENAANGSNSKSA